MENKCVNNLLTVVMTAVDCPSLFIYHLAVNVSEDYNSILYITLLQLSLSYIFFSLLQKEQMMYMHV